MTVARSIRPTRRRAVDNLARSRDRRAVVRAIVTKLEHPVASSTGAFVRSAANRSCDLPTVRCGDEQARAPARCRDVVTSMHSLPTVGLYRSSASAIRHDRSTMRRIANQPRSLRPPKLGRAVRGVVAEPPARAGGGKGDGHDADDDEFAGDVRHRRMSSVRRGWRLLGRWRVQYTGGVVCDASKRAWLSVATLTYSPALTCHSHYTMADKFDPYREALIVEVETQWPEEYDDWEPTRAGARRAAAASVAGAGGAVGVRAHAHGLLPADRGDAGGYCSA